MPVRIFVLAFSVLSLIACQSSGPEPIADCLGKQDIANMRAAYNTDPSYAEREYFLERVCLEAEIDKLSVSANFVQVGGNVGGADFLIVHYKKGPTSDANEEQRRRQEEDARRASILEAWMEDKEIGDTFQAMCTVDGFAEAGGRLSPGTPEFWDCILPE